VVMDYRSAAMFSNSMPGGGKCERCTARRVQIARTEVMEALELNELVL
jgi:hypothetical protein